MFSWRDLPERPIVIAHRGASAEAPENTLAAFELAIRRGADAIELDVRLSADGEAVVIHDATTGRTTERRGEVRRLRLETLKTLDAGSWFSAAFPQERIPTLDEVLGLVDRKVGVNIELKPMRDRSEGVRLVRRCIEVVRRHDAHSSVLLSSFQHSLLRLVKEFRAELVTGVLYHPLRHAGRRVSTLARRVGAEFFVCDVRSLGAKIGNQALKAGLYLAVYTIDTEKHLKRALSFGIHGIVTNDPGRILTLMHSL